MQECFVYTCRRVHCSNKTEMSWIILWLRNQLLHRCHHLRWQRVVCCWRSLQETYEKKKQEHVAEMQKKEEDMRQMFVVRVKEKEAELKEAEKEVSASLVLFSAFVCLVIHCYSWFCCPLKNEPFLYSSLFVVGPTACLFACHQYNWRHATCMLSWHDGCKWLGCPAHISLKSSRDGLNYAWSDFYRSEPILSANECFERKNNKGTVLHTVMPSSLDALQSTDYRSCGGSVSLTSTVLHALHFVILWHTTASVFFFKNGYLNSNYLPECKFCVHSICSVKLNPCYFFSCYHKTANSDATLSFFI